MLELRTIPNNQAVFVTLSDMPLHRAAIVDSVEDRLPNDTIARRLRELGFVAGEEVTVLATGPVGREPLLVRVGYTRFALRRSEAARVQVRHAGGSA
ncbi:Fe2+ transport system protein A [Xanthomonas phaseoli pv. phaseoli]|uniref:Fe2+ transport system protein A n=1 Tax=Xanthomonas campestris pv. phaseoli TaxID=317013 RepID=A0ABY1TP14_XANCH|nr:Fe2+ transport system protein A [Xanthomonas phaseoli pv. phaseoli]